jgi:TonB family protein
VRFVVDTLGAVDRASVQVLHATHALFESSVLEVLLRMRFVPAQVGHRNVRQLVEMPFHFRVER